jgi:uncharacterized protein YbjT (DUF2867 family)
VAKQEDMSLIFLSTKVCSSPNILSRRSQSYSETNLMSVISGYSVTALVRNPNAVGVRQDVHLEKGTPEKKEDIELCFYRHSPDLVFVNLASAPDGTFLTHCVTNLVEVMKKYRTPKIVYMSAFGVDDSFPALNWIMKIVVANTKMAREFNDHKGVEQILKQLGDSGIQWTVVRPVMLKNGPAREVKSLGDQGQDMQSFMPGITRASVAQFMVKAAEDNKWNGKTPVICN